MKMQNSISKLLILTLIFQLLVSCSSNKQESDADKSIPFELFTKFERVENASPLLVTPAPEWAAAAHAIVIGDTIHYIWSKRNKDNFWDLRHSYAPVNQPEKLTHDPRNPFLSPPEKGMDSKSMEYPCPFYNLCE